MTQPAEVVPSIRRVILSAAKNPCLSFLLLFVLILVPAPPVKAQKAPAVSGQAIYSLTQQLLAVAPKRFNGSPGHLAAEEFIKSHFKPEAAKSNFETDQFTANTPAGPQTLRNYIAKFPGKKDGIIVLASHYETNYPLRDINFFGANDGACTSALLIELGEYFRTHPPQGYAVWLVFDDGEEAVREWSESDSLYGTRHLAARWYADGTLPHIKALLVADMIGDKDLDIARDGNSTPWLEDVVGQAAAHEGDQRYFFHNNTTVEDDHLPFVQRGVPVADVIDLDYGPHDSAHPDGYHHTPEDTLDKISAKSLTIDGDVFLETIRMLDQR
jgi:glutaminyl-peptide cyclotransferase